MTLTKTNIQEDFIPTGRPIDKKSHLEIQGKLFKIGELNRAVKYNNILGISYFSKNKIDVVDSIKNIPVLHVDVSATSDEFAEVWTSNGNIKSETLDDIKISYDDENLYGCISFNGEEKLSKNTKQAYDKIFRMVIKKGFKYIYRIWNYIPEIFLLRESMFVQRKLSRVL